MKRGVLFEKKGDTLILESVIFIVLNLFFIGGLYYFVIHSASGAGIYEQTYAKQIALMIDEAQPNSTILIDMGAGIEIAKENGKDFAGILKIDNQKKEVIVSLDKRSGYSYRYYTGYNIITKGIENGNVNLIVRVES